MTKAVFLDRDGTINEEMGYINHVSRFKIFNYVPQAIRLLNEAGYKVIVVTNQSGVARGYFSEELVNKLHQSLIEKVKESSAEIDKIYYCPHHPTEGLRKYRLDCECRKPKTGMIEKARREFNLDMSSSYLIGDRYKDIVFGKKTGLHSIIVLTGYGRGEYTYQRGSWKIRPDHISENLLEAAKYIKGRATSTNEPKVES